LTLYQTSISAISLITLFCCTAVAFSQHPADTGSPQLRYDSTDVEQRLLEPDLLEQYRADPGFVYDETPEESVSMLEMIGQEIFSLLQRITGNAIGGPVIRAVFVILILGAVVLLLNQLLKGNIRAAITGNRASDVVRFQEDPTNIEEPDLDQLIHAAVSEGNYRDALRLTYRKALGDLSRAGLIEWSYSKTNQEYIYETEPHPAAGPLRDLTRIFDYSEYGDFSIGREGFADAQKMVKRLRKLVDQNSGLHDGLMGGGSDEQKG